MAYPYTPQYAGQDLHHKVSDLSESPYDPETNPSGLRGRESLVSLQTAYEPPSRSSSTRSSWQNPFRSSTGTAYAPVSGSVEGGTLNPAQAPATGSGNRGLRSFRARKNEEYETIHEDESIDMSLLKGAAPVGQDDTYGARAEVEPRSPLYVDVTSFSGPMDGFAYAHDLEDGNAVYKEEMAAGQIATGSQAVPPSPSTVMKEGELMATSPTLKRSFSRWGSSRRQSANARKPSVKQLGQDAANRRGEVIEVIMEETANVDISTMLGPNPLGGDNAMRKTTLPTNETKTQVFYPQPNWKPIFMRWPYLGGLIVLSVALGICEEILYQASAENGLVTFKSSTTIGSDTYFVIRFLPTVIAVGFGVLWQNTDLEVKRLEAFYQMSKINGARAAESINVDYVTLFNFTRPWQALRRRHHTVAISSIAALLSMALVPTLSAASFVLSPGRQERLDNPDVEKKISVDPVLARILSATLFLIAVLGCVLLQQLQKRRTGLLADVKGIAGLAAMAVSSHILMDFADMDGAKPRDIHHRLKNHLYVLQNSTLYSHRSNETSPRDGDKYQDTYLSENPHPLMLRKQGAVPFLVGIIVFLVFLQLILFTPASIISDKAAWFVTALAVCIKMSWGSLETSLKMMEPYYILSKRHAPPRTLTLDYTSMPFGVVALRGLMNRHWLVFLVGWGTIMSELLTVLVTTLSMVDGQDFLDVVKDPHGDLIDEGLSGQETVVSFLVALCIASFILLYMFTVATVVFVRRRHPFLPRQPNTISSVLAFMHQSKMLLDFDGTAKFTNEEMVQKLESIGKSYGLGWFVGRDGKTHCGVDQEELTGNYKHGINYEQSNQAWTTEWQTY